MNDGALHVTVPAGWSAPSAVAGAGSFGTLEAERCQVEGWNQLKFGRALLDRELEVDGSPWSRSTGEPARDAHRRGLPDRFRLRCGDGESTDRFVEHLLQPRPSWRRVPWYVASTSRVMRAP